MRRVLPWIGIIVLTCLVYAQSLGNDFVTWDDRLLIVDDTIVHGLTWANVRAAFTSYDPELYIPLTLLSYQINYANGGLQPFGYHLVNLLLHIANAIFVGVVIGKLNGKLIMENGKLFSIFHFPFSIIAALLFALHPLHTEAVVWAAARKDVLSTFFLLMTLWLYLYSRFNTHRHVMVSRAEPQRGSYRTRLAALLSATLKGNNFYWLSVGFFALALLSKVSVITWPLVLPILDWYRGEKIDRKMFFRTIPYVCLSILFGVVALGGKIANTGFLYEKILIGCRAVTLLLQKFFWPTHLSALYPFTKPISLPTPEISLSVLFVLFVFFVVLWLAMKKNIRLPLFAWSWFLLFLAPSFANILKGHNELLDVYVTSDRYAYLPSIGLLFGGAWGTSSLLSTGSGRWMQRKPKLGYGALFSVLFVFSVLSYRQSLIWKNTLTLFTHVSQVQPNAYVAWTNIGTEYVHQGKLNEGLQAYGKALAIRDDATTWYNVGQILRVQGKIPLAIQAYEKALQSSPLEEDAKRALEELKMENGKLLPLSCSCSFDDS